MKYSNFILLAFTLLFFSSCSSDDETADFIGTWKFNEGFIYSYIVDNTDISFPSARLNNEDCQLNEIIIQPNGKATVTTFSTVGVSLEVVDDIIQRIEPQLNCIAQEQQSKTVTWVPGIVNEGDDTLIDFPDYEYITLLDEDNKVYLRGVLYPNGVLGILSSDDLRTYSTEINGTTVEISERRTFSYKR